MSNIYLVGFMGAGKTSIGRKLGGILGWTFVDLDGAIEEREGVSVREIFARRGEAYFRRIEREELARYAGMTRLVVALGGGAFLDPGSREIVNSTGVSIWLDAPLDVLYERCERGGDVRPLLATCEEMGRLLEQRRPCYAQAHHRLDVSFGSVEALAEEVVRLAQP